jgi:hypothetical protein
LAAFQLISNSDHGLVDSIVTLNDRVYLIKQIGSEYNIFEYNLENDSTKMICRLHNYYPDFNTEIVISNGKMLFLTWHITSLHELDISKLD